MSKRILLITTICTILLLSFSLACCCPIAFPFGGNTGNTDDPKTSSIKGTCYVTTEEETTPVPSQTVQIGSRETTTDDDGNFEITGLSDGSYDVSISGGHLVWNETVTVKEGETLDLGDITLHPELPFP